LLIDIHKELSKTCALFCDGGLETLVPFLFGSKLIALPLHCGPVFNNLVRLFQARGRFAELVHSAFSCPILELCKYLVIHSDSTPEVAAFKGTPPEAIAFLKDLHASTMKCETSS
jgi:hypothetical protein